MLSAVRLLVWILLITGVFGSIPGPATAHEKFRFRCLQIEDGLSQSSIYHCFQDSRGFLWFSTEDGLNRYDGYEFRVYRNDPTDPNSLSYSFISKVYEDSAGRLWIGTYGQGLNRYDYQSGRFTRFLADPEDPSSLSENSVLSILGDMRYDLWIGTANGLNRFSPHNGRCRQIHWPAPAAGDDGRNRINALLKAPEGKLWLGTGGAGLALYDPETETITRYSLPQSESGFGMQGTINVLLPEQENRLLVGTEEGLYRFAVDTGEFLSGPTLQQDGFDLARVPILSLRQDFRGDLWIGTREGLVKYEAASGRTTLIVPDPFTGNSLLDREVMSLLVDRSHVLWVGTHTGLNVLDLEAKKFAGYGARPLNSHSLTNDYVRAFLETAGGEIWVGTYGGLDRWNRELDRFEHFRLQPTSGDEPNNERIYALTRDLDGFMWVGSSVGAFRYDPRDDVFTPLEEIAQLPDQFSSRMVRALYCDRNGDVWFGTSNGLDRLARFTGALQSFRHDPERPDSSLVNNYIYALTEDHHGNFWVGTAKGMTRLSPDRQRYHNYHYHPQDPGSLSSPEALALHESRDGVFWVGTAGGLNRLDNDTDSFTFITEQDGLPNNTIYAVIEDDRDFLWLSTNDGLSRYDPLSGQSRNYDHLDGLQSDEFNLGACYRTADGELMFGCIRGFNIFHPDEIEDNGIVPALTFTDFKLFNQSVPVGPDSPLSSHISTAPDITLTHKDRVFSVEFAVLHFAIPQKNRYSYRLEGIDEDWVDIGNRRLVSYSNLPPGNYKLHVRGANCDGIWNEDGISLGLQITPPFWRTFWFRLVILLVVGTVGIGLYYLRTHAIVARNQDLERKVAERTLELERANEAKSEFLANMSHEIRTPLNCILGMADIMRDQKHDAKQMHYLQLIQDSGRGLLELINDILDLSKIEAQQLILEPARCDLPQICDKALGPLALMAESKGLELIFRCNVDLPRQVTGDPLRLRQVLVNLLNNAIKFTESGHVMLEVLGRTMDPGQGSFTFRIADTGAGIESEKLQTLFEKFTQADASTTRKFGGTGLGLAISRQLVELMGGRIEVSSLPGHGSEFAFTIPLPIVGPSILESFSRPELHDLRLGVVSRQPTLASSVAELASTGGLRCEALPPDSAAATITGAVDNGDPFRVLILDLDGEKLPSPQLHETLTELGEKQAPALLLLCGTSMPKPELVDKLPGQVKIERKPVLLETLQASLRHLLLPAEARKRGDTKTATEAPETTEQTGDTEPPPLDLEILLVEDNPFNQVVARHMLERLGCRLELAGNGLDAVEMAKQHEYDVVLMDCQMPELDGYEATRRIRRQESGGKRVPIVAMTALAMTGDRERCLAAGMDDYLTKPVSREELARLLVKWGQGATAVSPLTEDDADAVGEGKKVTVADAQDELSPETVAEMDEEPTAQLESPPIHSLPRI
ncbi:MAG: two-component regulator propeller domain-containing protein [bacterium]